MAQQTKALADLLEVLPRHRQPKAGTTTTVQVLGVTWEVSFTADEDCSGREVFAIDAVKIGENGGAWFLAEGLFPQPLIDALNAQLTAEFRAQDASLLEAA